MVPTFNRPVTVDETLAVIELIERAITERRVVTLSFFKESKGRPWFRDRFDAVFGRRRMLHPIPVTRTVEPQGWDTSADGDPYMDVISYDSPHMERPEMRRIRLDRVAVNHRGLRIELTDREFTVTGTGLDPQRIAA